MLRHLDFALGCPFRRQYELVESEIGDTERKYRDDHAIQVARRPWVRLIFPGVPPESFGRELEDPCKDDCRHETDGQENDDVAYRVSGETDERKYGLDDLDDDPRRDEIRGRYTNDVAAF